MTRALCLVALVVVVLAQSVGAQSLTLAWDPSPAIEAVMTRIYARANGGTPQIVGEVPIAQTSTPLSVQYDTDYEFFATSLDITGLEGAASNSVFWRLATPPPMPPSADGTVSAAISDCAGGAWTLGPNRETLLNGQHAGGGYGYVYKLLSCVVWTLGADSPSTWYWWTGQWNYSGQTWEPGTSPPVPPTPQELCAADGYGNGVDEDGDGQVDEGCLVRPPADTTAPIVSLTIKRSGKSASYTVTATATDNVGIVSIRIYTNAGGTPFLQCATSPCSATVKLGKGSYSFTAVADDAAGNKGFANRTVTN